jgi:uncharacterized protein YndB with AHSA1/START domain
MPLRAKSIAKPKNKHPMQSTAVLPVNKSVVVPASLERAFEIFTAAMHQWWPREHTLNPAVERVAIIAEPQQGGRWFEKAVDGSECNWGRVLVWAPPRRVVFTWQLDHEWKFNADFKTELEVRFEPMGAKSTRVILEHRNLERYGVHALTTRAALDSDGGWMGGLKRYVDYSTNV